MSLYLGLAVGVLGALLQSTVLTSYTFAGAHADLVVVAVVGWAALRRIGDGLLWAAIGGIALDLFSAGPFGASVVALGFASLVAWLLGHRLRVFNQILVVASVPLAVFVYYLVSALILAIGGAWIQPIGFLTGVIGPAVALDTLIGPVVLFLLAWASHAITPPPWAPA